MNITQICCERRLDWDNYWIQQPAFNLLQSWSWGEFKEKLGWTVYRIAVENDGRILAAVQLLIKPLPLGIASIAYIPRDSRENWIDKSISDLLYNEVHRIAISHRAVFLKIEPLIPNDPALIERIYETGFKPSSYTNQPRATITLDLERSLDEILSQMRKKTRMYIRSAAEKGVTIRVGNESDLEVYHQIMKATAKRENFSARCFNYYSEEWRTFVANGQMVLLMAYWQDKLLAIRTVYRFGSHAAEFHAGSSGECQDLRPNYLLVWEAIKWAKEQGCRTYDFWGIPEPAGEAVFGGCEPPVTDRTDGLWGVYRFKSGFSKKIVYYVGAYDYVYNPFLYKSITNRVMNVEAFEKIAGWMDSLSFQRV